MFELLEHTLFRSFFAEFREKHDIDDAAFLVDTTVPPKDLSTARAPIPV